MEYGDVLKHLAPCGLDCARCADYEHGEIKQLSSRLIQMLGHYKPVARMKAGTKPIFNGYDPFNEILASFSQASCSGCRGENVQCPITTCSAKTCYKEKGVAFCFQCNEYPCGKQFTGRLKERWEQINDRMKEIGIIEYHNEQARTPRY